LCVLDLGLWIEVEGEDLELEFKIGYQD
jgi:hypothetical protein